MGALVSYPDRSLAAALTGGSWQATAPLDNLKDDLVSHVARSTNALAASSIILANLGASYDVRVVSLCKHNISKDGTIRARGYSDSGYTNLVADTGTVTAWPDGFTAQNVMDYPHNWTYCFAAIAPAQYWKIEIIDTANAAGYLEVGRCWIGEGRFEPARSILTGYQLGYELSDVVETSLGGLEWIEPRTPRRYQVLSFPDLTPEEIRSGMLLVKNMTLGGEFFFVTSIDAGPEEMLMNAYLARIKSASPLSFPYFNRADMPLEIKEKL